MFNDLVSVLIPCYNAERWIAETLESVLAQTWPNLEIIVVDDGSSDNSLEIAKRYESTNIKVIKQENNGASSARNRALRESGGDYIQYLDADDLLSPEKIKEQILMLREQPQGMLAVSGTVHFRNDENPRDGILEDSWPMEDSNDPLEWLLRLYGADGHGGMVHPAAWLIPRQLANAAGTWDERLSTDDDGEYFARVVMKSKGIRKSKSGCSYYRKHQGTSLSGGASEKHQLSALRSLDLKTQLIFEYTDTIRARKALARCYMERAMIAYPKYPKVTEIALEKVNLLGGCDCRLPLGGWKIEIVRSLFGWKIARFLSTAFRAKYEKIKK